MESSIKDVAHVKKTGKEERAASSMTFLLSMFISKASHATKDDTKFVQRQRKNENSRDFMCSKSRVKRALSTCIARFRSMQDTSADERDYCDMVLPKSKRFKHERSERNHEALLKRKDKEKPANQRTTASGAFVSPLLLGNILFSSLRATHLPLVRKDLHLRNAQDLPPKKSQRVKAIAKILKQSDHGAAASGE